MSKFIVYTDFHMTGKNPVHRTDDFSSSLINKIKEVYSLVDTYKVDFVLFLGDFFNNHRMYRYDILNELIDVISSCSVTTYAIIGQHDLVGCNPESYKSSTLCFMEKHCDKYKTIEDKLELDDVVFYASHNYCNFMESFNIPIVRKKKSILLAHHLITHEKLMFHTYITSEFLPCKYSAIFFGDAHVGMEPYYDNNDTLVWNPGSLARLTISDINRDVKCGIVNVESGKRVEVEEYKLISALPGNDVFAKSIIEQVKKSPEMLDKNKFIDSIMDLESTSVDIIDYVLKIGSQKNVDKNVLNYIESKRSLICIS